MKKILTLSFVLFTFIFSYGQENKVANNNLTHHLSSNEAELMKSYNRDFNQTSPPEKSVRNIAEWEPMETVFIAYRNGFGVPYSLIADISEYSHVTIIAQPSFQAELTTTLSSNGVNMNNCDFIDYAVDAWWSRDYSPWCIAENDSVVSIVDFIYNRPRPGDDGFPSYVADEWSVSYYGMPLVQTGGNYMTDGYGISVSTDVVYEENSISNAEVKQKMKDYLGIETYHVVPDPQDDYIKHVDCWGKFLDVDKILIAQVPTNDPRYNDYEATAAYFENSDCSFGYPYEVYRVQTDPSQVNPYTNSLIINGKVFVPQTGSYLDAQALEVYEEAMPGYEIIGVMEGLAEWLNTDALHCRTHGFADREMLFIKHYPLFDTIKGTDNCEISAEVYSYANNSLADGYPKLFYKIDENQTYEEVPMSKKSNSNYVGSIPIQNGEHTISYYIEAEDVAGKMAAVPIMKQEDPYIFYTKYEEDNILEASKSEILKVYPNPSSGEFFVHIETNKPQKADIEIVTSSGQTVYQTEKTITDGKNAIFMSLDLPTGIYFVKTRTEKTVLTSKLIVR